MILILPEGVKGKIPKKNRNAAQPDRNLVGTRGMRAWKVDLYLFTAAIDEGEDG